MGPHADDLEDKLIATGDDGVGPSTSTPHTRSNGKMSEVNGRYAVAEILPLGTALANVIAARDEPDELRPFAHGKRGGDAAFD